MLYFFKVGVNISSALTPRNLIDQFVEGDLSTAKQDDRGKIGCEWFDREWSVNQSRGRICENF